MPIIRGNLSHYYGPGMVPSVMNIITLTTWGQDVPIPPIKARLRKQRRYATCPKLLICGIRIPIPAVKHQSLCSSFLCFIDYIGDVKLRKKKPEKALLTNIELKSQMSINFHVSQYGPQWSASKKKTNPGSGVIINLMICSSKSAFMNFYELHPNQGDKFDSPEIFSVCNKNVRSSSWIFYVFHRTRNDGIRI